jgi:Domain of unknown function (DUF3291)
MARLVLTTFAIMKGPYGDPQVRGFEALTPAVFREAERSPGFIARAREIDDNDHLTNFERDWGAWGPFAVPSFYDGGFDTATDTRASTISMWVSIEAVRNFVVNGLHHKALRQREKWFRKPEWPTYAMWWVADDHTPNWPEAVERLERLHVHGPSAFAFTFEQAYDAEGNPLAVEAAHG